MDQPWLMPLLLVSGMLLALAIPRFSLFNNYVQMLLMYVGINIILATSLNLVNGYMGEFSLAHAGFMAVGAYTSALLTMHVLPPDTHAALFPLAVLAGGAVASLMGLLVAVPSFKVRGDYLAIITLAFLMIVKSALENIDAIGGPRGMPGIPRLTSVPWVFAWTVALVWLIRNFVYSRYGRGVQAIREDEIASDLMSVDTRRVKILAFMLSSFCAGVAGALFAHLLQFISPRVFDIVKTTEVLIMVYLGGIASIAGSILGATRVHAAARDPAAVDRGVAAVLAAGRGVRSARQVRHQPPGRAAHDHHAAAARAGDDLLAARHHGQARVPPVHTAPGQGSPPAGTKHRGHERSWRC